MNAETQQYLELLERRIALLGSLAEALVAARTDIVSLDIDGLESRIKQQERLCMEIRALDPQLDRVQRQCATHLGVASKISVNSKENSDTNAVSATLQRLHEMQASVKKLNDSHQILLRRSRRTVVSLLNSYHSFAMTYSDPATPRATVRERI